MRVLFFALALTAFAAERTVRTAPLLQNVDKKANVKINETASLASKTKKTGAKMVQDAYVAVDSMKTPPHGLQQIMFSSNFPNGNVCGENAHLAKEGSCAHNCLNNCRKSYATCNKMFKKCLKSGKWEALKKQTPVGETGPTFNDGDAGADPAKGGQQVDGVSSQSQGGSDDGSDGSL